MQLISFLAIIPSQFYTVTQLKHYTRITVMLLFMKESGPYIELYYQIKFVINV